MLELHPYRKPYELDARLANGGYVFEAKKKGWLWSSETGLYLSCDPEGNSLLLQFGKGKAEMNESLLVFPKEVKRDVRIHHARLLEERVGASPIDLAEMQILCPQSYIPEKHQEGVKAMLRNAVVELFPMCYVFELEARERARNKNSA